jgi:outer membrane protein
MMSGLKQVEALRQTVFSQESAVDAKSEGMRAGLATRLEVLDATRDLYMARRDLAKARYDYVLSSLGLKRWAGTLSVAELRQINAYFQ